MTRRSEKLFMMIPSVSATSGEVLFAALDKRHALLSWKNIGQQFAANRTLEQTVRWPIHVRLTAWMLNASFMELQQACQDLDE
jgi:hypothetical protein